jgi:hypothetical protein
MSTIDVVVGLIVLAMIMAGCAAASDSSVRTESGKQAVAPSTSAASGTSTQAEKPRVPTQAVKPQQPSPAVGSELSINFLNPQQLMRGQSTEVAVGGTNLELSAVEFTPPDGITVQRIQRLTEDQREWKKWSFEVMVAKDAQPGERAVTFISQANRSKTAKIRIQDHAPKISDLKIVSAKSYASEVNVEFSAFDEVGDISASTPCILVLMCGNTRSVQNTGGSNVLVKDSKNFKISCGYRVVATSASGTCTLGVLIRDTAGNESNELETQVSFR